MQILSTTGVATDQVTSTVLNSEGRDKMSIQCDVTGTATFQLEARAHPDAPWTVIEASGAVDTMKVYDYWPYVRLNQTAGAGAVKAYIVE